jgi:hypothetical protein
MVKERNFAELASEFACENFTERHEAGLELLQLHLRFFSLGFVDQPRNPVVFW